MYEDRRIRYAALASLALAVLAGLYVVRLGDYLLFHSLVEIFTVVIAAGIFVMAWNSRKILDNNYLLFVGIAYLFVAFLDGLHTLAYSGMGVFTGYGADLATQLWIAARYMQALSLLIAPLFLGRRLRIWLVAGAYAMLTTLVTLSIFYWKIFPTCFVEGKGLTPFKNISEYVISVLLVAAAALLFHRRGSFDRDVLWLLEASIALTIASELAFTLYTHPYGLANFIGHLFKLVSFYLIYRAIIVTGLTRPVDLLFRDLKGRERELQDLNDELDGYARMVSHDIRGPLASIKLAVGMVDELIERPGLEEEDRLEIRENVRTISSSVEKSFALVDDLLALARAGHADEQVMEVDIAAVVRGIAEERSAELQEREARVDTANELGTMRACPTQIYQLFSNLIGNSLAHNTSKGLTVTVSRLRDPEPGASRFLVRDNGTGIPEELIDHVFDPFFKGPGGGTGIGLSTVQRIVLAYGGYIRAYNEGGACFEFSLGDLEGDTC